MPGHARRIALLGAGRTGKTELAAALAATFAAQGRPVTVVPQFLDDAQPAGSDELHALALAQARRVLAADAPDAVVIADTTPLMAAIYGQLRFGNESLQAWALAHQRGYDLTLLTGLDLPLTTEASQPDVPRTREAVDALLRSALTRAGLAYKVVYGLGAQRLENALIAMQATALPENSARTQGQFRINAGRMDWSCESCSDPACEHRLFTGLLR